MRITRRQVFGLAVVAGLATAVDVTIAANVETVPGRIRLQAEYFDEDSHLLNDASLPRIVLFRMPLIPGNLSGEITSSDILQLKINVGEPTTLDLEGLATSAAPVAAPLAKEAAEAGLVVTPKDARLARFATLVAYPDTGSGVGGAKLQTTEVDQTLLLVYFDRPCRLSGVAHTGGTSISFDAHIASRGVHLLMAAHGEQGNLHVTHAAAPRVLILGITPRK